MDEERVWRPIDTAPKDGSRVIVWGVAENGPYSRPHIGAEDAHVAVWNDVGWEDYWLDAWIVGATHWQPFPNDGPLPLPDGEVSR